VIDDNLRRFSEHFVSRGVVGRDRSRVFINGRSR
jgi:hypothetical protein